LKAFFNSDFVIPERVQATDGGTQPLASGLTAKITIRDGAVL
jgi:hypothetical protein